MSYLNEENNEKAEFIEVPNFEKYNSKKKVTISGYCDKCHQRYIDTPVIDGVVMCPNCIE